METTNDNPLQEVISYAQALQQLPTLKEAQRHAAWQLSMAAQHISSMLVATDELKRRGQTLSPKLEAMLMPLRMLVLGGTDKSVVLPPGAMNLRSHFEELSGATPYQAPTKQAPQQPAAKLELEPKKPQEKVIDLTARFGQPRKPKE